MKPLLNFYPLLWISIATAATIHQRGRTWTWAPNETIFNFRTFPLLAQGPFAHGMIRLSPPIASSPPVLPIEGKATR